MSHPTSPEIQVQESVRREFYQRLDSYSAAPLWTALATLVTSEPRPDYVPACWNYAQMRALLMESGDLITASEAERRVLVLENPNLRGLSQITQSLYAGLQLILPGEIAPSHRHAAAALRLVIEGNGGYTAVDGERITMHPGDFIITPSWTFHDHGNLGSEPVIWLDGLDVPIVNMFTTSFFEGYPQETQAIVRPEGDAAARFGATLLPLEYTPQSASSPLFVYPYSRSREALDQLYRNGPLDAHHGIKLQYANPATGGSPMPTMAAFTQFLPAGFKSENYQSTDGTIYCVVEGRGCSRIGEETVEWGPHDVFVVPAWASVQHQPSEDSVLFSFSDRPAQKALGLWREKRG